MSKTNKAKIVTPPKVLIDSAPMSLQLVEDKSGRVVVRGEFAKCGIATENKRIYPASLWESQINRLSKALKEKKVLGEADHPADGQTKIQRTSHVVTDLYIENGVLIGEAEIVDTDLGKNLKALLAAGCKIGVSSRGYGSTVENDKGEQIVQNDYRLRTFDFVADPADADAYPEIVAESVTPDKGKLMFEGVEILDPEDEQALADKFAASIMATDKDAALKPIKSTKDELAALVVSMISDAKAEIREQVRSEMLSDPAVAGAKAALSDIVGLLKPHLLPEDTIKALEAKESEINKLKREVAENVLKLQKLEGDNTVLATHARSLGYQLHVERSFNTNPDADAARKSVGDVNAFKSVADLKSKVSVVVEEFANKRANENQLTESKKIEEVNAMAKDLDEAANKIELLDEALSKSIEANKLYEAQLKTVSTAREKLELQLHIETQLTNHPQASKIKQLLVDADVKTKASVDKIIENYQEAPRQAADIERTRARVRNLVGGSHSPRPIDEETRRVPDGNTNGIGVSMSEFNILAGVKPGN